MSFQLKPDKKESVNKTIRFPLEIAEQIEKVSADNNVSFTGFVIQACVYALSDLEKKNKQY